ncbi:MAG: formate dehydrogenase accessory sulfurtransferase FdhD [Pseudolabrys sp.]|nr:formate dehydrogenase accessory sulfurtransferase FdhD [Pseudolabrys sp.]
MIGTTGLAAARDSGRSAAGRATAIDVQKPPSADVQAEHPAPVAYVPCQTCRGAEVVRRTQGVPEETPIALTFNGTSYAVMMASPSDLADFAVGFSLTEGVIDHPADIESLDVVAQDLGVELRMWLAPARASAFAERRRRLTGPTGCGLCGIESLAGALPPIWPVTSDIAIAPQTIAAALSQLTSAQTLYGETKAVHAAGFFVPDQGLVSVREDVGRHNALDKLIGDLAHRGIAGRTGFVVLTSRISVEMVHKAAVLGASIIVAISAPTALAIRIAEQAGITLVAIARSDGFEIFTGAHRMLSRLQSISPAALPGKR